MKACLWMTGAKWTPRGNWKQSPNMSEFKRRALVCQNQDKIKHRLEDLMYHESWHRLLRLLCLHIIAGTDQTIRFIQQSNLKPSQRRMSRFLQHMSGCWGYRGRKGTARWNQKNISARITNHIRKTRLSSCWHLSFNPHSICFSLLSSFIVSGLIVAKAQKSAFPIQLM